MLIVISILEENNFIPCRIAEVVDYLIRRRAEVAKLKVCVIIVNEDVLRDEVTMCIFQFVNVGETNSDFCDYVPNLSLREGIPFCVEFL